MQASSSGIRADVTVVLEVRQSVDCIHIINMSPTSTDILFSSEMSSYINWIKYRSADFENEYLSVNAIDLDSGTEFDEHLPSVKY